ncbi:MAG TPA: hypothetical protein EYG85_06800 [Crocinitomix sp.]|nr:hypothetical protein [Crocinitomix sp.]
MFFIKKFADLKYYCENCNHVKITTYYIPKLQRSISSGGGRGGSSWGGGSSSGGGASSGW